MKTAIPMMAVLGAVVAAPLLARADAPARMPVQGFLTTTAGAPVDGPTQVEFRLYDLASGGTAWFSETQVVTLDRGELTAYLGAVQTLDLARFRGGAVYLGITLMNEAEMTPRLQLGTVPYAAFAQETAAVPTGAVMMFDLAACPAGWSELTGARGRALVGLPAGGTLGGTVGTPLGDIEDRAHGHTVDPAAVTSTSTGAHTHTVNPAAVTSSAVDLAHTHQVDPDPHQHRWATWGPHPTMAGDSLWRTYGLGDVSTTGNVSLVRWDNGLDGEGVGTYPLATEAAAVNTSVYYTQMADLPAETSSGASIGMNHGHSVNVGLTTSSTDGVHTHTSDVPATPSSSATTGQVMPYLQLLVCRRL